MVLVVINEVYIYTGRCYLLVELHYTSNKLWVQNCEYMDEFSEVWKFHSTQKKRENNLAIFKALLIKKKVKKLYSAYTFQCLLCMSKLIVAALAY